MCKQSYVDNVDNEDGDSGIISYYSNHPFTKSSVSFYEVKLKDITLYC